ARSDGRGGGGYETLGGAGSHDDRPQGAVDPAAFGRALDADAELREGAARRRGSADGEADAAEYGEADPEQGRLALRLPEEAGGSAPRDVAAADREFTETARERSARRLAATA